MSYRRKYPRQFVGWRCRTCGCAGVTGAKDMENLIRGIRRHHNEKSPGCEFSRENVAIHEPGAEPQIQGFNPLGFPSTNLQCVQR